MKTTSFKSSFGFSAVHAGQRNVNAEPQLVATSSDGGFRLTSAATRILGVMPGDYIMFINNISDIDRAIKMKTPEVVAFAEEAGYDVESAELAVAIHKEFDMWAIAKGIKLYDGKGLPLTTKERLTVKDKESIVRANFSEILEKALASGNDELVAALTHDGVTEDEQVSVLAGTIEGRDVQKYWGSKCNNVSGMTGVGVTVTFADANVWGQLRSDIDKSKKLNRIFELNVEDAQTIMLNNGYEDVKVNIIPLGSFADKEAIDRTAKGELAE